jgi:hypothetical protein
MVSGGCGGHAVFPERECYHISKEAILQLDPSAEGSGEQRQTRDSRQKSMAPSTTGHFFNLVPDQPLEGPREGQPIAQADVQECHASSFLDAA